MIHIGIDFGNLNIKVTANQERGPRAQFQYRAITGTPGQSALRTGDTVRYELLEPWHVNIGVTAEQESHMPQHVISAERYFAPVFNGYGRELSLYAQQLLLYGIGKALQLLHKEHDYDVSLAVAVAETHFSEALAAAFGKLIGEQTVMIEDRVARKINISIVTVKSQMYCAMFSQYMGIDPDGVIYKKDSLWEQAPGGLADLGSQQYQFAVFFPQRDASGRQQLVSRDHVCLDEGMLRLLDPLQARIRQQFPIYNSMTETELLSVLETGWAFGVSFEEIRAQLLREKALQVLGLSRTKFASGEKMRQLVLFGQGFTAALSTAEKLDSIFLEGYNNAFKAGVKVKFAVDDFGQENSAFAVSDGFFKRAIIAHYQPK